MMPVETIRAMLDERGVDWDYGITGATTTRFSVNGIDLTFTPMRDGLVCSTILTPEKVIAATLGRGMLTADDIDAAFVEGHERAVEYGRTLGAGTCHISVKDNLAETDGMGDVWLECDACGWQMPLEPSTPRFHFCPNCGRKVVGE